MAEWQDPEVTLDKIRVLQRKLHRIGIENAKFIAAFEYEYKHEDYRKPKKDWESIKGPVLFFEIPNAEIYSVYPTRFDFPLCAKWEEKAKLDVDFWEKILIWQSEHPEFFEDG